MEYGLIGKSLGHSFSPQVHAMLGEYGYCLRSLAPEELGRFFAQRDFLGLNVTIPYKETVLSYCDALSPAAREIGAVNTVINRNGKLYGDNTDLYGMLYLAREAGISLEGKRALILGGGGASRTAQAALRQAGARATVVSRRGPVTYAMLGEYADTELIINATPVGMYPDNGALPLCISRFPRLSGVLDVVYNPLRSALVLSAMARGVAAAGGLGMLVAQAKRSSELFTGSSIPEGRIGEIWAALGARLTNIVLVGMPGSGKSEIGRLLAGRMGRELVDTDERLQARLGESVPAFLAREGEARFRAAESEAIREAGRETGKIIATGGGAVLREENYAPLKQNGLLFFLRRGLADLPTAGRPISQRVSPSALYAQRLPRYERFADHAIDNNGPAENTAAAIEEVFYADMRDKRA